MRMDPQENRRLNPGFWQKTLAAIETCREESTRMLKITKLKWDATQFKRQKLKLYQNLGKMTHELTKLGDIDHPKVKENIQTIETLTKKIEDKELSIQELSALVFTKTKKT